MSLINDALKRAQEDKDRNTQAPSPTLLEEPAMEAAAAPNPRNRNRLVAVLLVGVLATAGGWCFLHFKKSTPAAALAYSSLKPMAQPTTQPAVQATVQPTTQPTVQATALKIATTQPVAAVTRPRVRIVAPPPGGLAVPSPTTQNAPPSQTAIEGTTTNSESGAVPNPLDNLLFPPAGSVKKPGHTLDDNELSTLQHSIEATTAPAIGPLPDKHDDKASRDNPPAAAAKNAPATQPAAKPERSIATAASVSAQFHVSCIMFSDQGSTAIINGSPVKVGQTIRADGVAKTGLPEEAVVKKIERGCVEVELNGEKFLLRI
jgi:hypothetical protein